MKESSSGRLDLADRGALPAPERGGVEPRAAASDSRDSRYLPDIDGLRALAVLAVIFFHVGFQGFSGGYVGVDVFFVVSGFLITRLIRDQIALGKFSFSRFYLRRARRLFAALFFTLLVTFGAAYILFSPEHLEQFGGSLLYVILSISNFYFWGESGYFDTAAQFKPLLHTWSLAVEEQFYLVWPLTLFLLLKKPSRRLPPVFIVVAGALSLFLGSRWLVADPSGAFYLAPFRVVEFAFGAILVWLIARQPRHPLVLEALVLGGLGLIAYAVVTFTPETSFPTLISLAPCLGAALVIYAGSARYSGLILRNPLAVGIGLISYSLYLIHWPIIVFYRYYKTDLSEVERYAIVGVSLAAATLMYWFVEQPFRRGFRGATPSAFGFVCAMLALVLTLPAAHSWANGGWPWRFGATLAAETDLDQLRMNSLRYAAENVGGLRFNSSLRKVLVVGDSHAGDLSNALSMALDPRAYEVRIQAFDDLCYLFIATGEAPPGTEVNAFYTARCKDELASFRASLKVASADVVVFSAGWTKQTAQGARDVIELTRRLSRESRMARKGLDAPRDTEVRIVLMGPAPLFLNLQSKMLSRLSDGATVEQINRRAFSWLGEGVREVDAALASSAAAAGARFASKERIVCQEQTCTVVSESGKLMLYDASHWTLEGARLFGERTLEAYPDLFD
jgi:peptidoglycan/LPS O-acetylase OafA/YrhL